MMSCKKKRHTRALGSTLYQGTLFVISVEGRVTEREYFNLFKNSLIEVLSCGNKSSLNQVLKRMNSRIKQGIPDTYEAWIVIDDDDRKPEEFSEILKWEQGHWERHIAISKPCFEYWLLLHFESNTTISSGKSCIKHLKNYCKKYNKHICARDFTKEKINAAIKRAKALKIDFVNGYTCSLCATTVYQLVEKLIDQATK